MIDEELKKQAQRVYNRKYWLKNKKKIKAKRKKYNTVEYQRKYYEENKETLKVKRKAKRVNK